MDNNASLKNTITELTTPSGDIVKCTLNFFLLYGVKAKHPDVYSQYNKIIMDGMKDVFDALTILYVGYLCANPELDIPMAYEEFLKLFEDDWQFAMSEAGKLMGRKKKAASATRS